MALKKKIIVFGLIGLSIALVAAVATYIYFATQTFTDTKTSRAEYDVSATNFLKEFKNSLKEANLKYTEKIIRISGTVSAVEPVANTLNIKMEHTAALGYIIFELQPQDLGRAQSIKPGDSISVKGSCSGGVLSEILGTISVSFKRCTINN